MIKAAVYIILFYIYFFTTIFAFRLPNDFKRFTIKDGLTQNHINCIFQDNSGFLWIGTNNGLNKFDGYKFITYKFNPTDSSTITNNRIKTITNFDENNIIVGTDFGFNIVNSITGKSLRKYLPSNIKGQISTNAVQIIFKDSFGIIYIGTFGGGLFTYHPKNDKYENFINDPSNKGDSSLDYILEMMEDKSGDLWIASYGGLSSFNRSKKTFKNFKPENNNIFSLTNKIVTSLAERNETDIWIGTIEGINVFNKESENFVNYKNSAFPYLNNNSISGIHFVDNSIWIATASKGIYVYSFESNKMSELSSKMNELKGLKTTAIFEDRSNNLWIGTVEYGLLKFTLNNKKFNSYSFPINNNDTKDINTIFNVYEDSRNNIWLGTKQGVFVKTTESNNFLPKFESQLKNKLVTSILEDSRKNILIGTTSGFYIYETESGKLKSYFQDRTNPEKLKSDAVSVVYESSDNKIWIGTIYEGITSYNYSSDSFYNLPCAFKSDSSLLGYNVTSIEEDNENNLWIGTLRGLSKYDIKSKRFTHYTHEPNNSNSLPSNSILSLLIDNNSVLWIGTYGGGLVRYKDDIFKTFLEKDGLPSSVITKIIIDSNNLWLASDNGISQLDLSEYGFSNYNIDDGLQTLDFTAGTGIISSNGTIYFSTANGLIYFNPDEIVKNYIEPKTLITSLKILNEEKIDELNQTGKLDLEYTENYISIEFSALDYTNPGKNNFSYLLQGKNSEWVNLKERHYVDFADLQPGEYTFIVKGSNNDLVWDQNGAVIYFSIAPPFWNTWWFYSAIFALILAIVFSAHRYIVNQKLKQYLEINKIRLDAANDFHDHVGHTLTKISLFSELLKKDLNREQSKAFEYVEKISSASSLLYNDAKDFIWSLDPKNDSVYELAVYLKDFGEDFFSRTGISFNNLEINEDLKNLRLEMKIKREIIYIFKEAMNNALKHSNAKNVYLNIYKNSDRLFIQFNDDGIGISSTNESKGRGIKSIKNRCEKLGFDILINTDVKDGFSITINSTINKLA